MEKPRGLVTEAWIEDHGTSTVTQAKRWSSRLKRLSTAAVHILAILGFIHSSSYIWSHHFSHSQRSAKYTSGHLDYSQDIYPDTDYPLRPAHEPWDISTSYPYPRNLSISVSEGTWLRIAVHPRLPEIVFDMLGDLYCMSTDTSDPISSARPRAARQILTGIPFDKEAEFSSDGSHLVFISDAGFGVDNVWTMPFTDCDTMSKQTQDEARASTIQQTNSTFRFFSSPAFHPTEPKILATKWFLTGRPNGAGEIWELPFMDIPQASIPERGGRRIVQRRLPAAWSSDRYLESQLGSEQARYVPSGDGMIFSSNVRDDRVGKFTYNKDVHAGINAVFLLNTTTGQTSELVAAAGSAPNQPASPGGANMPRLSHDGRTLAFIRRNGEKEVLALKDMQSGTLHYIYESLNYDVSTIPAFMGAYPNYGWTAEDTAIVFWAQGQIWRLDITFNSLGERVARGPPSNLPFEARIDLALGETRYSQTSISNVELATQRKLTAIKSLRVDWRGTKVVFESSGDNYVLELDSGLTRPLAKLDPSKPCYAPSFIGDSDTIIQACWDGKYYTKFVLAYTTDQSPVPIDGLHRGRYISPVSDGSFIAYVRTGKDYMFGDVEETFGAGIWLGEIKLPSAASRQASISCPRLITGVSWSVDTKLAFSSHKGKPILLIQNPTSVFQYNIKDGGIKNIVKGKTSVEMAVSPDPEHATTAFRDFQHVWLSSTSACQRTSKSTIWSKPGDSATPQDLIRLSQIGGHDVTFSGDGSTVFWALGPTLYQAEVDRVSRHCQGTPVSIRDSGICAESVVKMNSIDISFDTRLGQLAQESGDRGMAFINGMLISMAAGDLILPNATVLVEDGRIIAVGAGSEIAVDKTKFKTVDVGGGVILPGFIDIHGHWGGFLSPYPLQSWEMETFLGYGVTTIHNPASRNVFGHMERNLIEKGYMYGPRVFHTGDVLYGSTQPSVYTEINSQKDAMDALLRIRLEGEEQSAFTVKNYQLAPRSSRQRVLLAACDLNMLVVPEGGWSFDWGLTYFIDGYTSQEHPLPIPWLYDDVLSLIAASGSSYTPLAVMSYGGIFGQHWVHQTATDIPGDQKLRKYVRHDILESLTEVKQAPNSSYLFFNTTQSTAKLAQRGVRTNIGAHGEQPIGFLYHSEMLMMSIGGQKPYDILNRATIGNAISLGLQDSIGSVEAGKLADLVIYPPGTDTVDKLWESSKDMKYVMRGGVLFDVEDGLVEVWPRAGRRQDLGRLNAEDEQA